MPDPTMQAIKAGIAPYDYEQRVLLRLLRFKGGSFTSEEFDRWFSKFPKPRWMRARYYPPDSFFMLGTDKDGFSHWKLWLELLQHLALLGMVKIDPIGPGGLTYILTGEEP